MKISHFIRTGLVAALGFVWLAAGPLLVQDVKPFLGDWEGAVMIDGAEITLVCHFISDEAGGLTGTIDSPDQGAFGLALADIVVEGKEISFGIDDPNVPGDPFFKGALDDSGTIISGDFSQGGGEGSFELKKQKPAT